MSWKLRELQRKRIETETGVVRKERGGKLTVCLVYPNHYRTGMSNLGFQSVYALLNSYPDVLCERAFLPDKEELSELTKQGGRLLSLESGTPLTDFHIIAFSISFENDYLNLPTQLQLAGIPAFSKDRGSSMPLIMAGGAALFLNPEPVADFMDLIAVGEAEVIVPPLLDFIRNEPGLERDEVLQKMAQLPGVYVPALYGVSYDAEGRPSITCGPDAPLPVERGVLADLDTAPAASTLFTPDTEFGDMFLVEVSRGCPRGCRFCAAGFIYLPYRRRSRGHLQNQIMEALAEHKKVGLVGAAVSDYPDIGALCSDIVAHGGAASVSSLRLENLGDDMLTALATSGHKTVALAPEGGSQRLRDLVKKGITEADILDACDRVTAHGILNIKLYFIIGLPTETMADLEEMLELVKKVRARVLEAARKNGRIGEITLSVNPFIPKPFTPFQWCGMEDIASLEKKLTMLRKGIGPLANVRLQAENLKEARLQAIISRGDRRLAKLFARKAAGENMKKAAREAGVDLEWYAARNIGLEEPLPWEIIAGADRSRLQKEYRLAFPLP